MSTPLHDLAQKAAGGLGVTFLTKVTQVKDWLYMRCGVPVQDVSFVATRQKGPGRR